MANPAEYINSKTELTKCKDGFWLYDGNRGMNLAMRASTAKAALIEALEYYQERLIEVENQNKELKEGVNEFLVKIGDVGLDL